MRKAFVRPWTNEGAVSSRDTRFIDLCLEDHDGDVICTLNRPQLYWPLDVHVEVGWHSSVAHVVEIRSTNVVEVAQARIEVVGNHNRLNWEVTSLASRITFPA